MAEIVLGACTSHSPQVSIPAEMWADRGAHDRTRSGLIFRGIDYEFEALAALRSPENLADEIKLERQQTRHETCQAAILSLARDIAAANLDVIVVIGDDQDEQMLRSNRPALAVYCGSEIPIRPRVYRPNATPAERAAGWAFGEFATEWPGASELGDHLIRTFVKKGIDVAYSDSLPNGKKGIGHAFAFVYTRLMTDNVVPSVPVLVNTYFAPNQPTARRCVDYGRAIAEAVGTWDSSARVGVIGSGGMSHFVIDAEFDRGVLDALVASDISYLEALPEAYLQEGSSEIKNWITAAAAMNHLKAEVVAYEPCYRSLAGTGCAMGFVKWQ